MQTEILVLSKEDFQQLQQKLDTILEHLSNSPTDAPKKVGRWIPESEAKKLLGKGTTTLWKMRKRGELEWTKVGNEVYYSLSSIDALLEKNKTAAK